MTSPVGEKAAVNPFHIDVPEEDLVDLRRRIAETRWPERETVDDNSQGVPLAMMQELARCAIGRRSSSTWLPTPKGHGTVSGAPSMLPRSCLRR
jgi:hypothetical protein